MLLPTLIAALLMNWFLLPLNCIQKDTTGSLQITIEHTIDGVPLQLNKEYHNHFGEDFRITKLKYYISNIRLLQKKDTVSVDDFFLVDAAEKSSGHIKLNIPAGEYTGISFLIGVDSLHNAGGAQSGALDPLQGMFWTWNSGYIMAKLEGSSSLSSLPNNRIEYHIGGYKEPNNSLRPVTLKFKKGDISINRNQKLKINLAAELQRWFDGLHPVKIQDNKSIMTPGNLANEIADNYSTMFKIVSAGVE